MIFYHIQASANTSYVLRLVSMLYHPGNFFYLSLDRSIATVPEDIRALSGRLDNIVVVHRNIVCWGGYSQVDVVLESLKMFADSGKCEFYINIGDSDLPLWGQDCLHDRLRAAAASGIRGFMHSWEVRDRHDYVTATGQHDGSTSTVVPHGRTDICFVADADVAWMFDDRETSPVINPRMRFSFSSFEQRARKTLYLQPVTLTQKRAREDVFRAAGCHVGRQWIILHRELAEHIVASDEFAACAEVLSTTFIPDECVIQTGLALTGFDPARLSKDNLRLWLGAPGQIGNGNIADLENSPAAFGRKIRFDSCDLLFRWADRTLARERAMFHEAAGLPS